MLSAPGVRKEHSLTTSFSFQPLTRGGRTTSEGEGIAQYFSGRFPRLVWMVSRAIYIYARPSAAGMQISLYTPRVCVRVCVRRALRVEVGVPACVSVNTLMRPFQGKWTVDPGRYPTR